MFVQLTRDYLDKKAGERIDVADTDAQHLVEQGAAVVLTDDPITPAVTRAFEGAFSRPSAALNDSVDAALKRFAQAQGRSRRHAVPLLFGENGGDPHGKSFGDWLLCVRRHDAKTLADKYDSHFAGWDAVEGKAAMNTQSG